jgi:hypothetical protein
MTILVIGGDTNDFEILELAKKIITEAEDTLMCVVTTNIHLNHFLLETDQWEPAYPRQKHFEKTISSSTGDQIYISELTKKGKYQPLHRDVNVIKNVQNLFEILESHSESSANLLRDMIPKNSNPDEGRGKKRPFPSKTNVVSDESIEQTDDDETSTTDDFDHSTTFTFTPRIDISSDSSNSEFQKRVSKKPKPNSAVTDSLLLLNWRWVLSNRYFNQAAIVEGFAKSVNPRLVESVKSTLEVMQEAPNFGYDATLKSEFKIGMERWFMDERLGGLSGWYTDCNISLLTRMVNISMQLGPFRDTCLMLDPWFFKTGDGFESRPYYLKRRWSKLHTAVKTCNLERLLVPVHVSSSLGSSVRNHFALLEINVKSGVITIYDSLMPSTRAEAEHRYRDYIKAIKQLLSSISEDGTSVDWKPFVLSPFSPQQKNFSDCGVFMMIIAFYIAMGRSAGSIKFDFKNGGSEIRLFLAKLFLDAATDGMPPPPPPQSMKKVKPSGHYSSTEESISSETIRERPVRRAAQKTIIPPPEINGLHLRLCDVTSADLNSGRYSQPEVDLITDGHSRLPVSLDFTEFDFNEARDFYTSSAEDIQPINNTLQDARNANYELSEIKGEIAPRSMIDCSEATPGFEMQIVKKVVKMLRENESLQWLTKTRKNWTFKMLRSLSNTPAQFWHRDYSYKSSDVNQLYWNGVPLILMVSFEDGTALDFPSGRVEIPRCRIEVVRGDKPHRGVDNPNVKSQHRLYVALDTADSVSFRRSKEGFETFEPCTAAEQLVFDKVFGKSRKPQSYPTLVQKRKL